MYANSRNAASAYARVGLETGVVAASPQQLIIMLYEGAELAVRQALQHQQNGDAAQKSAAIIKAGTIIVDGLLAALDPDQQGDLVNQLGGLYVYMNQRLATAHVDNQPGALQEVLGLLRELHDAWEKIASARPHQLIAA
jgi:flagellar protein FliS